MTREYVHVVRHFVVDVAGQDSYEDARNVVERGMPVPIRAGEVPYAPAWLTVFTLLMLDASQIEGEHRIAVEWVGGDGQTITSCDDVLSLPPNMIAPTGVSVSFVANFTDIVFPVFGSYKTRLTLDDEEIHGLPVDVMDISENE